MPGLSARPADCGERRAAGQLSARAADHRAGGRQNGTPERLRLAAAEAEGLSSRVEKGKGRMRERYRKIVWGERDRKEWGDGTKGNEKGGKGNGVWGKGKQKFQGERGKEK